MPIDGISSSASVETFANVRVSQPSTGLGGTESKPDYYKKPSPEKVVKEDKKITEEEVINVIERANKDFVVYDRKFEFSIHEATKQIMVKVIDTTTDEVIRELPPEKVLDMVAAIWEVAGIIVDRKI